jgi:hypothetical protein
MQLQMSMSIDVIESQTGDLKSLELRRHFTNHLPPGQGAERQLGTVKDEVIAEMTVFAEELGNVLPLSYRFPICKHEVEPDTQVGQPLRALDGVRSGRRADHEAGRAENTAPMRLLDGGVNRLAETKIVGRYNQVVQCAGSRLSRMNAKNSTPSRKRRAITCGLRNISEKIDAILGARK